jgi:hypothetical protein
MRITALKFALFLLSIWLIAPRAGAQTEFEPGSQLHVYVLTFGPGDEVWEKFGHNAVRIIDDSRTNEWHDVAYNWGTFDFGAGKMAFAWKFFQGRLNYSIGLTPGQMTVDFYKNEQHRSVYQQELNLSSSQKMALKLKLDRTYFDLSQRYYRYDYYQNNCSSRVRDVVDDLVDHRLFDATNGKPSGTTFRWHTDRLTISQPWLYVFIDAALGHPVDQPIDRWQEMFLPEKLHDRLNEVTVHLNGYDVPLVKRDEVIYTSTQYSELPRPPLMAPWLLGIGVLIGGIFAGLGHFARRHWAPRWSFILLTLPWILLMGLGGLLLCWGWLGTDHAVLRYNENVMQVSVLALPLIVMLPMLALGKRWGALATQRLMYAIAAIALLGLALKVLPWFYQVNWNIIALCLPVNLALAYAAWMMGKSPAKSKSLPPGKGFEIRAGAKRKKAAQTA